MTTYPFVRYWTQPTVADVNNSIFNAGVAGVGYPVLKNDANRWCAVLNGLGLDGGYQYYTLDGRFGARASYVKLLDDTIFHVISGDTVKIKVPRGNRAGDVLFYVAPSPACVCSYIRFAETAAPVNDIPMFAGMYLCEGVILNASSGPMNNAFVLPAAGGSQGNGGTPWQVVYTSDAVGKLVLEPVWDLMNGTAPSVFDNSASASRVSTVLTTTPVQVTYTTDFNTSGKSPGTHFSIRSQTGNVVASFSLTAGQTVGGR